MIARTLIPCVIIVTIESIKPICSFKKEYVSKRCSKLIEGNESPLTAPASKIYPLRDEKINAPVVK